jgi:hypothetical protein
MVAVQIGVQHECAWQYIFTRHINQPLLHAFDQPYFRALAPDKQAFLQIK